MPQMAGFRPHCAQRRGEPKFTDQAILPVPRFGDVDAMSRARANRSSCRSSSAARAAARGRKATPRRPRELRGDVVRPEPPVEVPQQHVCGPLPSEGGGPAPSRFEKRGATFRGCGQVADRLHSGVHVVRRQDHPGIATISGSAPRRATSAGRHWPSPPARAGRSPLRWAASCRPPAQRHRGRRVRLFSRSSGTAPSAPVDARRRRALRAPASAPKAQGQRTP